MQHAIRSYATTLESDRKGLVLKIQDGEKRNAKRLSVLLLLLIVHFADYLCQDPLCGYGKLQLACGTHLLLTSK